MRHRIQLLLIVFTFAVGARSSAAAEVLINIDKSHQTMTVSVDGMPRYTWRVSTGRAGYGTPNGVYRPEWMAERWFSKKYYDSPMPHSIFFHGGYAIHGSYEIARLGGPASHGCVRLHPSDAAKLYALVTHEGMEHTTIVVSGSNPKGRVVARSHDQEQDEPGEAAPEPWGYGWYYGRQGRRLYRYDLPPYGQYQDRPWVRPQAPGWGSYGGWDQDRW